MCMGPADAVTGVKLLAQRREPSVSLHTGGANMGDGAKLEPYPRV